MKRLLITMGAILLTAMMGQTFARDLSNYYTPNGFQTPNLRQGQYMLTLYGLYGDTRYDYDYIEEDRASEHNHFNHYYYFRGIYAFTDKILLKANVSYYPSRTINNSISYIPTPVGIVNSYRQNLKGYLSPNVALIYKPTSSLEVYGSFYFFTSKINYSYYDFDPPDAFDTDSYENKYRSFTLGINYLGEL